MATVKSARLHCPRHVEAWGSTPCAPGLKFSYCCWGNRNWISWIIHSAIECWITIFICLLAPVASVVQLTKRLLTERGVCWSRKLRWAHEAVGAWGLLCRAEISHPVQQSPAKWPGTGKPENTAETLAWNWSFSPLMHSLLVLGGERGSAGKGSYRKGEEAGRRQRGWEGRDKW